MIINCRAKRPQRCNFKMLITPQKQIYNWLKYYKMKLKKQKIDFKKINHN